MQLSIKIENMLNKIAQNEGFINYKFEYGAGSNSGEGYQGELTSVKLFGEIVEDGVATSGTLNLLCKEIPSDKRRRAAYESVTLFEREIHMYTRVLPAFVKFQQEKGLPVDESFLSFPKVYAWTSDKVKDTHVFIMEDLRARNFVMWSQHVPMTLSHEELVFKQLGRFHAISFALKDQRPEVFAEFESLRDILTTTTRTACYSKVLGETIDRAISVLENDEHKRVIKRLASNFMEVLKSFDTKEAVEKFGIVNHGDLWINNLLFQYTENVTINNKVTQEVKNICFLDWQFSHFASPALDILYHLVTSTRKKLRDQSYGDLLNIYYNSLSDTIRKLGSDPEKLFRFSDLQNELKANGKYGLLKGMMLLPLILSQSGDLVDLDEYSERFLKGEKFSIFTADGRPNDIYIKEVNEMIGDVISYGYDC